MKKIPSLFVRDLGGGGGLARDEIAPGCEWVMLGEGRPTVKLDGSACMMRGGKLFKRYDAKQGKTPPVDWEPCEGQPDPVTGHWPGWLPVGDGPEDKWHREGLAERERGGEFRLPDGTYELLGPKVQANPYGLERHTLREHGADVECAPGRTLTDIKVWLERVAVEGIVYWHPDGRMAKVKARDFGIRWPQ